MKVIFFGTPQIAVPFLDWLIKNHDVVGVITKKDEPVGRGYKLTPPPVKVLAEQNKIKVFQPTGKWDEAKVHSLTTLKADVGVAVAYGRLVPRAVFNAAQLGTFNIHFSLLPRYRGAGPLQWSLINGDTVTGVTAFWIQEGMDDGPMCHQESLQIDSADNALTLKEKLTQLGVKVMGKVMNDLEKGTVIKKNQEGDVVLAPQLKKEDGNIDWGKSATQIVNLIRGVTEWPGATTTFTPSGPAAKQLKIYTAQVMEEKSSGAAGKIIDFKKNEGFIVQCGAGQVLISEVQPEAKKKMSASAFWSGARLKVGDMLG